MKQLEGIRIVNTRAKDQAAEFSRTLRELGAEVLEFPTIKIAPPEDRLPLRECTNNLSVYDCVVLTSANGVNAFMDAVYDSGLKASVLGNVKICAVGEVTAEQVRSMGLQVSVVPEEFVAEGLLEAIKKDVNVSGKRFLMPRGDLARPLLPEQLRKLGAVVDDVIAYRNVTVEQSEEAIRELFEPAPVDVVTFTSSSTAKNFASILEPDRLHRLAVESIFASIGPQTSKTLRDLGLSVGVEANPHNMTGLVEAVIKALHR